MEGVNSMRYPPHTPKKLSWARFFILKTCNLGWIGRMALLAVLAVVAAVVLQVRETECVSKTLCPHALDQNCRFQQLTMEIIFY